MQYRVQCEKRAMMKRNLSDIKVVNMLFIWFAVWIFDWA